MMNIDELFEFLQPILERMENEDFEGALFTGLRMKQECSSSFLKHFISYFCNYTKAHHVWNTSYEYSEILTYINQSIEDLSCMRTMDCGDISEIIFTVLEEHVNQLKNCLELDGGLLINDFIGIRKSAKNIIHSTKKILENEEIQRFKSLKVFTEGSFKRNRYYAMGFKILADSLILKDQDPIKFLRDIPTKLHELKDITKKLKDMGCIDEYSEIDAHYYILKKHHELESSIENHLMVKEATLYLNKAFYYGQKWADSLFKKEMVLKEEIMKNLDAVTFVEKTILPDIFLSNYGKKFLECLTIGFSTVKIRHPFKEIDAHLDLFLNFFGSGFFRLQFPIGFTEINQVRNFFTIPSSYSGNFEFILDGEIYHSFLDLVEALLAKIEMICKRVVDSSLPLSDWRYSESACWFSYIDINELILVPLENVSELARNGTLNEGAYTKVTDFETLKHHPFMKGLIMPPRESKPTAYDWINYKEPRIVNLAYMKAYPENTFITTKNHAILYFPGVPTYIINEIRKTIEYAFNISTILFELKSIMTFEKENLKVFSDRVVEEIQRERKQELDKILKDMTQKSIDINEFSNITLLASETLNSINLTKYQDHSEMLDKILQRMEAFDTMKDIQTTHGYVIDTHRNLLEMTRGIVENFDALKEEFRNKLLEFLNSILSIIAITAAIDYIAPVFSWNDELKLIVLVAFVILFTTTSQLYYFLKRRKISFW